MLHDDDGRKPKPESTSVGVNHGGIGVIVNGGSPNIVIERVKEQPKGHISKFDLWTSALREAVEEKARELKMEERDLVTILGVETRKAGIYISPGETITSLKAADLARLFEIISKLKRPGLDE